MTDTIDASGTPFVPDETDSELAATASRELARASKASVNVRLEDGTDLLLPKAVTPLLIKILTEMAQGNAVTLIPLHAELTTQEAANLLNISRPYLSKLLERGEIAHHKVGTHRRIKFTDLESYRMSREKERINSLSELARQAQDEGMGY
ncbi:helix-turn-helix domain-containing protein [Aurantiacibacter flavus]|uniref:Helix-turn-helix domain-containing protein n=1 Tax=Aurantiacibacter flavus TaxID=3145232 RepID=A0ABV0CXE8_9SPHN